MKKKNRRAIFCAVFGVFLMAATAFAAENPVKNPSFTAGTLYWENAQASDEGYRDTGALLQQIIGNGTKKSCQQISGLEAGAYTLTAYVKNGGGQESAYLYGQSGGDCFASTALPVSEAWQKVYVRGITVLNGTLEIGIFAQAKENSKILLDDVMLEKEEAEKPFLLGGDITELTYVEECGGKFFDPQGREKDALQIMAENGMNLARIRVYNQTGKGTGKDGYYLPDYYQTQEDALNLARRAKSKGMALELTLHYSDYWTNGGTQMIPSSWQAGLEGLPAEEAKQLLEKNVYEYTLQLLQEMKAQGTVPEYISLGNEIQGGILYPYGRNSDWETLARFLNAGAKACREVCPQSKIILHLDDCGNTGRYHGFFDKCAEYGVDYDIIGPSYYPFWTKRTVEEVVSFCNEISQKYDKDIMIMETGYNFHPAKPDGWPGQLTDNGPYESVYAATQQGHRDFMAELVNGLKSVEDGRCIGDLYWDPVMIACDGVGWAYQESTDQADSNVVSNTALFDFDGKAIKTMEVYRDNQVFSNECILAGTVTDSAGTAVPKAEVTLNAGQTQTTVQTDRYGMFFVRVPSAGQQAITAEGLDGEYIKEIENAGFIDGLDFILPGEELCAGAAFRAEKSIHGIEIRNVTERDQEIELVCVYYDPEGILTGLKWDEYQAKSGESVVIKPPAGIVKVYIKQENELSFLAKTD